MIPKAIEKLIRKQADQCINPGGNVGEIRLENGSLMIEIKEHRFGNFVDAKSLMTLLRFLQGRGIVGDATQTMWIGFKHNRMWAWCAI